MFAAVLGLACSGTGGTDTTQGESDGCTPGSENCPCIDGGVCEAGLLCASNVCTPAVDPTTSTSTGDATSGTDTSSTTGTTGLIGECMPADGSENAVCSGLDPAAPYCSKKGECVPCTGLGACPNDAPACNASSGLCVECRPGDAVACSGNTPVCDDSSSSCVACTAHDQCPESACDLFTGACFPTSSVYWVNQNDPNCKPDLGTEDDPFCTIADAMTAAAGGKSAVIKIFQGVYTGPVVVPSGLSLAILNVDIASKGKVGLKGGNESLLQAQSGAKLLLDGLTISGNANGNGMVSTNAAVWFDRCELGDSAKAGLSATVSDLRVHRTLIANNGLVGIDVSGGSLSLVNTFVTINGKIGKGGGISAHDTATLKLLYTTVIANEAAAGFAPNIVCDEGQGWDVTVRNSAIIAKGGDSLNCVATVTTSAVDGMVTGDGNFLIDFDTLPTYFAAQGGIYSAKAQTALATVGRWLAGDPATDFDGDLRPTQDGAPDFAGADRVP